MTIDINDQMYHALKTLIVALTPSKEQIPGQDEAYLRIVAIPRAKAAIEAAEHRDPH